MSLNNSSDGLTSLITHPTYYEIIMYEARREVIDSFLARIEVIWGLHGQTRVSIPILVVNPEGNIPLSYTFNQGLSLVRRFSNLPPSRMVFLGSGMDSWIGRLVDNMIQALPLGNFRHRHMDTTQRAEAIAWLSELGVRLHED